ncbi:MAG: hypothetical protein WDA21_02105 [Bacilli bacterium]
MKEIRVFFITIIDNIKNFYNGLDSNERILLYFIIALIVVILFLIGLLEIKTKTIKNKKKILKEKRDGSLQTQQPLLIEDKKGEPTEQDEVQKKLEDSNKIDLEKIQKQLEEDAKTKSINLTSFEKEQEETAIISYDELKRNAEREKPVSLNDMVMSIQKRNEVEEAENQTEKKEKYKPSPFISPIYGIEKESIEEKEETILEEKTESLEQTLNIEPISQEIKKNDEFLKALKDFRRNLE